jgi:ATP-binding cassette subfamily B protein
VIQTDRPRPDPVAGSEALADDVTISTGFRILTPFARQFWPAFAAAALLASLSSLAMLGPFWAVYRAVDDVVGGVAERSAMYRYAGLAAVFLLLQYALMASANWISHRGAFATLEQIRLRIGRRLGRVPLGFLTSRRSGAVQRTLSDDIERLELFLAHAVPDIVSAFTALVFMIVWLMIVDWRMALVSLAVVALALPIMAIGIRRGSAKLGVYTASMARMNASVVEFVRAMPVVRTFNGTRRVFGETKEAIDDAARYQAEWGREFLPMFTVFYVLVTSPILTILPVGLWLWHTGAVDTSTLLFFFVVGLGFTLPLLNLVNVMLTLANLGLGARLVKELDEADVLPEVTEDARLDSPRIEVTNVEFSYSGSNGTSPPVLQDVTFEAEPGEVTAIVGPSGAGKSTLARLMVRFWDVDRGSIRVGGVDVREMPISQLMDQVAFVFQETFLFNDSVRTNLRFAKPDATEEEIVEAAKAARAHEFVSRLPEGYETQIGESGGRLSGGERQRLAVARAILKDAPIVILDEATAYADPENEVALQGALDRLMEGRTVIVIAHRLSTVAGADQTLVFEGGRIVERGRHADLIRQEAVYASMWEAFTEASSIALTGGHRAPAGGRAGG